MTRYSQPTSARTAIKAGFVAGIVVASLLFAWVAIRFGIDNPPSSTGDESSYDSIAWELSRGNGFSIDYTDQDFRKPYDDAAASQPDLFFLPQLNEGPVAFRPPLMSGINAVFNLLFGRQFFALRSFNILLMAATAGLIVTILCRHHGLLAATVVLCLILADVRSRLYARALLTESLACFLCALLTLALLNYSRHNRRRSVLQAGFLTGLSILTRSIVVLWIPGLLVIIFLIARRQHGEKLSAAVGKCALFLMSLTVVVLPWAIRNVTLLDEFAPMGTQGMMELSAGYSDIAWENSGVWQNLPSHGFFRDVDTTNLIGYERELALAAYSRAQAFEWSGNNLSKLPLLAAMKVFSEFRPNNVLEATVLLLMCLGIAFTFRQPTTWIMLGLLLTNAFSVAMTWSVQGRFLVPQLFVIYVLAGQGILALSRPKNHSARRDS